MSQQITNANFKELVNGDKPVMVDFWAEWCGPCRMIGPAIEELAEEYKDQVVVGKVNVDENDELAGEFGIRNIPTILFFKNGEVIDKHVGAASKSSLEEKLKKII
ncbi:thioredoxin [Bacteroidia bacterium]|nr:thioredoxin [Bacteroidia bacterium]GHT62104.1 thioredoxin [Bacteroidia bacterium]